MIIYTAEIRKKAQKCFKKGMGYKATAHQLNLPVSAVREWNRLWKAGQFREDVGIPNNKKDKFSENDIRQMIRYHGRGFSYTRIGEMFGCSGQYVSRRIRCLVMAAIAKDRAMAGDPV